MCPICGFAAAPSPLMNHIVAHLRLSKQIEEVGDCWVWVGRLDADGYGTTKWENKTVLAHRLFYQFAFGGIPNGLEVDHLCRVHACVKPSHLEAVTKAENQARGIRATAAACKNGHPWNAENTRIRTNSGARACRACDRMASFRYRTKAVAA